MATAPAASAPAAAKARYAPVWLGAEASGAAASSPPAGCLACGAEVVARGGVGARVVAPGDEVAHTRGDRAVARAHQPEIEPGARAEPSQAARHQEVHPE